jgi:hypothetical protein
MVGPFDLPSELYALIERKELPQQLGQQLLDYAKPEEIQELVKLARSSSPGEVKRRAREIVEERMPPKPLKEKPPEKVFSQFLEICLDMYTDYEAIAELVRQDLGERQQMLLYLRRFKQAEFVAQLLLSIVETSDRLEPDELEYQPSLRRISFKEFLAARRISLTPDTGPAAQPEAKQSLPPLKLRKRPPAA